MITQLIATLIFIVPVVTVSMQMNDLSKREKDNETNQKKEQRVIKLELSSIHDPEPSLMGPSAMEPSSTETSSAEMLSSNRSRQFATPLISPTTHEPETATFLPLDDAQNTIELDGHGRIVLTPPVAAQAYRDRIEAITRSRNVSRNESVTPPLHTAAANGNKVRVQILLYENNHPIDGQTEDGRTPLYVAAANGHEEIVTQLIERRADINLADADGVSPLHAAAAFGHTGVVPILINARARINDRARTGVTPLYLATARGHTEIVELLLAAGADVTIPDIENTFPLHAAITGGFIHIVRLLLDAQADANCRLPNGITPLYLAAAAGNRDLVALLVERGAQTNLQDEDGGSPLHVAVAENREDIVQLLLDHGANVNAVDTERSTPLHDAAYDGFCPIARRLIARGASINARSQTNLTPLHLAVNRGHRDLVRLLLQNGAHANAFFPLPVRTIPLVVERTLRRQSSQDNMRLKRAISTLLFCAAQNNHLEIMELLLEYDAFGDHRTCGPYESQSIIDFAVKKNLFRMLRLLLKYGLSFDINDQRTREAITEAFDDYPFVADAILREADSIEADYYLIYHCDEKHRPVMQLALLYTAAIAGRHDFFRRIFYTLHERGWLSPQLLNQVLLAAARTRSDVHFHYIFELVMRAKYKNSIDLDRVIRFITTRMTRLGEWVTPSERIAYNHMLATLNRALREQDENRLVWELQMTPEERRDEILTLIDRMIDITITPEERTMYTNAREILLSREPDETAIDYVRRGFQTLTMVTRNTYRNYIWLLRLLNLPCDFGRLI